VAGATSQPARAVEAANPHLAGFFAVAHGLARSIGTVAC
jgi:hypothetical protein